MKKHMDTFMNLMELGTKVPPYQPTHYFPGEFINESHKILSSVPIRDEILIKIEISTHSEDYIQGWLRREDAMKLYELAYFATGDILELGTHQGLSASILSQANVDSPNKKHIYSCDRDPSFLQIANRNLQRKRLTRDVSLISKDAMNVVNRFKKMRKTFSFVFIDHAHDYESVFNMTQELPYIVKPGGFCLFHDYNDRRNTPEIPSSNEDYGVYQAVLDGLKQEQFSFYGVYGCSGLYRKNKL